MKIIFVFILLLLFMFGPEEHISADIFPENQLSQLNWMKGYWAAEIEEVQMEEYWMPASGGVMIGLHRDVFPNNKSFFEYLRIEQTEKGISYLASPRGSTATEFPLKEMSRQKVTFENPGHDFPQRIIYSLKDDTTLVARIEGNIDGRLKHQEWIWFKSNS